MRRAILALVSLMIFTAMTIVWARARPGPMQPRPVTEPIDKPDGDDQAEVIVRSIEIVPSDKPGDPIDASQGTPHGMESAWVVRFEVTKVLKGQFPRRELRILVHSPSRDLGVSLTSQRGVLHRDRSETGWPYRFVPE